MKKLRSLWVHVVLIGLVPAMCAGLAGAQEAPAPEAIATINGKPLLRAKFYERLEQVSGEKVLADMIARQLLLDAFDQSGLKVTDEDVDAEVAKIKQQAPDEASWQQFLVQQGMTEPALREIVAFQVKLQKLGEKDIQVTEEGLKQHFAENAGMFGRPETVELSEIVVKDKQQAEQARQQLQQPQADFGALARQVSLSPTKEGDGKRPEEPAGQIQPEALRGVVAALKPRQISPPVEIEGLWWIVRLDRRRPARVAEYDAVKDQVRQHYMTTHAKNVQGLLEEMRKTADVRVLDPKYQAMSRMFGPAATAPAAGGQQ